MRNLGRLWNIHHLGSAVEDIIQALNDNKPADRVINRIPLFTSTVEDAVWEALKHNFKGSEFELPCLMLLRSLYGENSIEYSAGPNERGADAICSSKDPVLARAVPACHSCADAICSSKDPLGIAFRVAVQIKMWDWDADSISPLSQLREAFTAYDGITAGVVMTTAARTTDYFEEERKKLESELSIPIKVITRKELVRLFLAHLPGMVQE